MSLQYAQIIADLQTLQNAEPAAAQALLTANKNPPTPRRRSRASIASDSSGRPDKFGRRQQPGLGMSRVDSRESIGRASRKGSANGSGSGNSSGVGTPAVEETDEDLKRAKTLVDLFEMRGKFKQMGDMGLTRARERVDAVVANYAKKELEERERVARARHLGA